MEVSGELYSSVELSLDEGSLVQVGQVGTIQQSLWTSWRNTNSVSLMEIHSLS
jgi:hypothetical protein